ncbi:MAG: hypothetical protein J0H71_16545 [Rhizobiales bacterium]|nr:hypothetical protein [Hyphomicrobiales bacterium]
MSLPVVTCQHADSARDADGDLVQDWLFLVLRYAISREARDQDAVLDLARKMDTLDREREREAFRFFRSHSERLCAAIAAPDTPGRRETLMAHARRIGQSPLQQAFLLICRLETRVISGTARTNNRSELWKGLQRR